MTGHSVRSLLFSLLQLHVFVLSLLLGSTTTTLALSRQQPPKKTVPYLPLSAEEIVSQASTSISRAFVEDGIHRQVVRLPLSNAMYGDKEEGFIADRALGWQGGPQETLRFLEPLASRVLRTVEINNNNNTSNDGGLPPRIQAQTLLDFDGSSLVTAEHPAGALYDIQALLQPNTDKYYLTTIQTIEQQFSDTPGKPHRLFVLVNPSWRDKSSWGFWDGAAAQAQILDRYTVTFAIDQFILQGQKLNLVKAWPDDWSVFWTPIEYQKSPQDQPDAQLLGTFAERPEYWEMERLLKEAIQSGKRK